MRAGFGGVAFETADNGVDVTEGFTVGLGQRCEEVVDGGADGKFGVVAGDRVVCGAL